MRLPILTKRGREIAAADAFVSGGDRAVRQRLYDLAAQSYNNALRALTPYKGKRGVDPRINAIQERLTVAVSRRLVPPSVGKVKEHDQLSLDPELSIVKGYIRAAQRAGADTGGAEDFLEHAEKGYKNNDPGYKTLLREAQRLAELALDRHVICGKRGPDAIRPTVLASENEESPTEEFECPACGSNVGAEDPKCRKCGVEFEDDEEPEQPGLGEYAASEPPPQQLSDQDLDRLYAEREIERATKYISHMKGALGIELGVAERHLEEARKVPSYVRAGNLANKAYKLAEEMKDRRVAEEAEARGKYPLGRPLEEQSDTDRLMEELTGRRIPEADDPELQEARRRARLDALERPDKPNER